MPSDERVGSEGRPSSEQKRKDDAKARPAFYAFAPTDWGGAVHPYYSSVNYTRSVVAYLYRHHRQETNAIFRGGGWFAAHATAYEQPFDFSPVRPDGTVWDLTLRGYEGVLDAFRGSFGGDLNVEAIPVMSIQGGVFTPDSVLMEGHTRLGSDDDHARRTVEMFLWLEENSPLQAMCPWLLSVGTKIGSPHPLYWNDACICEEVPSTELRRRSVYEAMKELRLGR